MKCLREEEKVVETMKNDSRYVQFIVHLEAISRSNIESNKY